MNNSLVLFSGGMDSTIALYFALHTARMSKTKVHALTVNYGQRHKAEVAAALRIINEVRKSTRYAEAFGTYTVLEVPKPPTGGSLLEPKTSVRKYVSVHDAERHAGTDPAFVPYRNVLLLTYAAMYAYDLSVDCIVTGLRGGFPDCTEKFEQAMQGLLNMSCPQRPLRLIAPTHNSRKHTVGLAADIPECMDALALSLTCFEGSEPPCGQCLPCLKRAEGFFLAGLEDPIFRRQQNVG